VGLGKRLTTILVIYFVTILSPLCRIAAVHHKQHPKRSNPIEKYLKELFKKSPIHNIGILRDKCSSEREQAILDVTVICVTVDTETYNSPHAQLLSV
jgi:hypothetical protein